MKPVTLDTLRGVPPRNGHPLGDGRHAVMKRRVEARDLWDARMLARERLDQTDLSWQMVGRKHRVPPQFGEQCWRDPPWLGVPGAMDHAMANRAHGRERRLCGEPIDEKASRSVVIGAGNAPRV